MIEENIVQFVRFTTGSNTERFESIWEQCASESMTGIGNAVLQKVPEENGRKKFDYISQHVSDKSEFIFKFPKLDENHNFPDHAAVVTQLGGYVPVQLQCKGRGDKTDVKILVFVTYPENDFGFYHRQTYRHLNIYEAYYENCLYSYVMEFFVQEPEALTLVELLRKHGVSASIYYRSREISIRKAK